MAAESAVLESLVSGRWAHFAYIAVGERTVPTEAIELRLATELRKGGMSKWRRIKCWIGKNER